VLYSKTDDWYVQPIEAQPLSLVNPDGTWSEIIHTGSEYAALVVVPSFQPPPRPPVLPRKDGTNVFTVARVLGTMPGLPTQDK
jgi:hypothetical protein